MGIPLNRLERIRSRGHGFTKCIFFFKILKLKWIENDVRDDKKCTLWISLPESINSSSTFAPVPDVLPTSFRLLTGQSKS